MAGETRSVKVKIDNVRKVYDTRNGEMIALNGVNLDIMENALDLPDVGNPHC